MREAWLLVLAREPVGAKTRLAAALDPGTRAALAVAMLGDVLEAARDIAFARRFVVTESGAMRAVARAAGVETLDVPLSTTNDAAVAGLRAAAGGGADAALVLAADLPLLVPNDLEAMVDAGADDGASVVIAPDRHRRGTNALLVAPPPAIRPAFGAASFPAHRERARAAALRVTVIVTPGLSTDVDDPDDLALVVRSPGLGSRAARVLRRVAV